MRGLNTFNIMWCSAFLLYDVYYLLTTGNILFLIMSMIMVGCLVVAITQRTQL